jgi:hypothetical protein
MFDVRFNVNWRFRSYAQMQIGIMRPRLAQQVELNRSAVQDLSTEGWRTHSVGLALIVAVPRKIHTILTDNGIQFRYARRATPPADGSLYDTHVRHALPRERHRAPLHQDQPCPDQRSGRTDELNPQGRDRQTLPLRQP